MPRLASSIPWMVACAAPGPPAQREEGAPATPAVFAPGIVSGPRDDLNASFSPDGRELYFSRKDETDQIVTILVTHLRDGRWSEPRVAPFSGRYSDVDPMVTPDGTRLYFSSYRPRAPGATEAAADADIWFVERRDGTFGEPVHVAAPVSTPLDDLYPSLTHDGVLYFARWDAARETGDLFRARPRRDGYDVERMPAPVNTDATEYDPYISPDERFVVFASSRAGGLGGADLYLSEREGDGWSTPRNLGPQINSPARDYCPVVTPDGKHFLFTRKRTGGRGDVYWISRAALGVR